MHIAKKIIVWFLGATVGLALLITALLGVHWMRAGSAAPIYGATLVLGKAPGNVTIIRDEFAIPHIEAQTLEAALFALGFVHAQDRYWQMDLTRRAATGRLTEILGEPALGRDRFMRIFNFKKNAADTLRTMDPQTRRLVEIYSSGVEAWRNSSAYKRPAEYTLTFSEPEPWTPVDTVLVQKMLWMTLSGNASREHVAMRLRRPELGDDPDALLAALFPAYKTDGHVSTSWTDMAATLGISPKNEPAVDDGEEPTFIPELPAQENSNNWVVSGDHTASGQPLLANDPHLSLTMPGFWYLAHLKIDGADFVGATVPGLPAILIGHNGHAAWGITNNQGSDVQDFYIEELHTDDPDQYRTPQGWATFETREEVFKIRFGKTLTKTYMTSRHGPVMPREIFSTPTPAVDFDKSAVSVAWTVFDEKDQSIEGALGVYHANDVESLAKTLRKIDGPVVNYVLADKQGNIGFMAPGEVPIRDDAHETKGLAYADGSNPVNDWKGLIPKDMTPYVLNPANGTIVNANAKAVPFEYPYFRGKVAVDTSRQQRIQDLIDASTRHDLASFKAIQLDKTARNIQDVLPALLTSVDAASLSDDARDAVGILKNWNGEWQTEAAAPLIFATWIVKTRAALLKDDLGDVWPWLRQYSLREISSLLEGGAITAYCDNQHSDEKIESCAEILVAALEEAVAEILATYGTLEEAHWGNVSTDRFMHMGLGPFPIIGEKLSRTAQRGAGYDAPNVAITVSTDFPRSGFDPHGPGLRFVIDMATPETAQFALAGGQSGHFASDHYDDLLRIWERGNYIRIQTNLDEIGDASVTEIIAAE